jgi:hypothetical protein
MHRREIVFHASKRQQPARKAPPVGKAKYLHEDEVINLASFGEGPKQVTTLPTKRKTIPGSTTLSIHASARHEKTTTLHKEWRGQWGRQVEPLVEEANSDGDIDMDADNEEEEEAEGDDGGISVDVVESVFPGHELAGFPKGPSYEGHVSYKIIFYNLKFFII